MSETADKAQHILETVFGLHAFRGFQKEVIETVASGRDALVLMPTGGGKSLCYQIPALMRDGVAVVVSPLIALMADQVSALRQLGVAAAYLNSTQTSEESQSVRQALRQGRVKLLYVAPERLVMPSMLDLLERLDIALFAIDEAHCVSPRVRRALHPARALAAGPARGADGHGRPQHAKRDLRAASLEPPDVRGKL